MNRFRSIVVALLFALVGDAAAQNRQQQGGGNTGRSGTADGDTTGEKKDRQFLDARVADGLRSKLVDATVWVRSQKGKNAHPLGGMGVIIHRVGDDVLVLASTSSLDAKQFAPGARVDCTLNPGQDDARSFATKIVCVDPPLVLLRGSGKAMPPALRLDPNPKGIESANALVVAFEGPFHSATGFGGKVVFATFQRQKGAQRVESGSHDQLAIETAFTASAYGAYAVSSAGAVVGFIPQGPFGAKQTSLFSASRLLRHIRGGVLRATFTERDRSAQSVAIEIRAVLGDLADEIQNVTMLVGEPVEEVSVGDEKQSGAAEKPKPLANAQQIKLRVESGVATGEWQLENAASEQIVRRAVQFRANTKGGRSELSEPRNLTIRFGAKSAAADAIVELLSDPPPPQAASPLPEPRNPTLKLPAAIMNVKVASSGRRIVMQMAGLAAVGVLDLAAPDSISLITLSEPEFVFAAGGDALVVYLKKSQVFEAWNLETRERVSSAPTPFESPVVDLAMGHALGSRVAVFRMKGVDGVVLADLMAVPSLELLTQPVAVSPHARLQPWAAANFHSATSAGLSKLICRPTNSASIIMRWLGDRFDGNHSGTFSNSLAVGNDGAIYAETGMVFDDSGTQIGQLVAAVPIPAVSSPLVMGVQPNGALQLYAPGMLTPIAEVGRLPEWVAGAAAYAQNPRTGGMHPQKRIVFAPELSRMLFFPFENDRVMMRTLDVAAALAQIPSTALPVYSLPPLAIPGKAWRCAIRSLRQQPGLKYELQMSPSGATVSAGGVVQWIVPESQVSPTEKFIVRISGEDGAETLHTITLRVEAPAAADSTDAERFPSHVLTFD